MEFSSLMFHSSEELEVANSLELLDDTETSGFSIQFTLV